MIICAIADAYSNFISFQVNKKTAPVVVFVRCMLDESISCARRKSFFLALIFVYLDSSISAFSKSTCNLVRNALHSSGVPTIHANDCTDA